MLEQKITIINSLGLHARAASQLVKVANKFESAIRLNRVDTSMLADAKTILNILTLASSKGTEMNLVIEGTHEDAAMESIVALFENGFGEM
jgi:phosphocarrier protein